ncbi:MAG: sporulation initiation inhibitor Soj [Ignavibacteriae bacterium HGW-Ignavibacteriae-2]|jgi:chromosome partitioning protein|nr:MAG: sporulation initiation inhibitor Soj [Ignavibacteriae bacterium HGW-Ignavibacteriae-2]
MKLIVVINNKGGVGKTTSVVNLASCFSSLGKKTLLVDLDPSASASVHLGFEKTKIQFPTLCDYLIDRDRPLENFVSCYSENYFVLPSEFLLAEYYQEIQAEEDVEFLIKREDIENNYDIVLFDCPPNTGSLALNALSIADFVLIPVQAQYSSVAGLNITLDVIDKVNRHFNKNLKILGFFATFYDRRIKVTERVVNILNERFGDKVLKSTIGVNSKLIEAFNEQETIYQYASSSKGAEDYKRLAIELLNKIN